MKLLVVIVNYRVTHLAIDCLHSVAKEIASVPGIHVAICENGSGDGSAELIRRAIDDNGWSSWCTLTALDVNLGFTGGNNAILRPALESADKPQYFLLLNSDTIVRPNAFKALIDFMDNNPEVGIGGSRLEDPDGTPQRSAFRFQSPLGEFEGSLKLGLLGSGPACGRSCFRDGLGFRRQHDHPARNDGSDGIARRRLFHLFR